MSRTPEDVAREVRCQISGIYNGSSVVQICDFHERAWGAGPCPGATEAIARYAEEVRAEVLAGFEREWMSSNTSGGGGIYRTFEEALIDQLMPEQVEILDGADDWTPPHKDGIKIRLIGPWEPVTEMKP